MSYLSINLKTCWASTPQNAPLCDSRYVRHDESPISSCGLMPTSPRTVHNWSLIRCCRMYHHGPRNITMQHVGKAMNTLQLNIQRRLSRVPIDELMKICEGIRPTDFGESVMVSLMHHRHSVWLVVAQCCDSVLRNSWGDLVRVLSDHRSFLQPATWLDHNSWEVSEWEQGVHWRRKTSLGPCIKNKLLLLGAWNAGFTRKKRKPAIVLYHAVVPAQRVVSKWNAACQVHEHEFEPQNLRWTSPGSWI